VSTGLVLSGGSIAVDRTKTVEYVLTTGKYPEKSPGSKMYCYQ